MSVTLHDTAANVPASVVVVFPTADPAISGSEVYAKTVTLASLALDQYEGTFGRSGTQIIHDSAVAHFTIPPDFTPANEAELLALAEQIATDFYLWRLASANAVYRTVVAYTEEGMSDIEYVHGASIATVVRRSDWDPEYGELKHAGTYPSIDNGCDPKCIDVIVSTSPIFNSTDVLIGIQVCRQQICWNAFGCPTFGEIICEINPPVYPPPGGSGSGSGAPKWWCVEVQNCTDVSCADCEPTTGVECVQYAFTKIGDSRCVLLAGTHYRKETAVAGPFNNQDSCKAGCGAITTACCGVVPQNLCALLSDGGGVPDAAGLGIDLAYVGIGNVPCNPHAADHDCTLCEDLTGHTWKGSIIFCGHPAALILSCGTDGNWYASVTWNDGCANTQYFSTCNGTLVMLQCTPKFHLQFRVIVPDACNCGGGGGGGSAGCPVCPLGIPTNLVLRVVSDCAGATSPIGITYDAGGANGAGWYSPAETVNGHSLYWFMECVGAAVNLWEYCDGLGFVASFVPLSCSPFDTGDQTIPDITQPCCSMSPPTLRVTET